MTRPARRIETVSGAFGRVHVRQSDAVWFISSGVVAREVADGRLVRLPIATGLTEGPIGLMVQADSADSPAREIFAQAVGRALRRLGLC